MSNRLGLFAGHYYYPSGGAEDFRAFADNEELLKQLYADNADKWSRDEGSYPDPWGQIVDMGTMEILLVNYNRGGWDKP